MSELLEAVYREHRQGLYSLAVTITASHQLAEDAVHNAFARMIRTVQPEQANLVPYVYRSVRNAAIDLCRKDQVRRRVSTALFASYQANDSKRSTDPKQEILTKETHQQLRETIDALPENYREAIVLKAFAGLTFQQIGLITETSPKTIATRYRRAIEELHSRLLKQLY